MLLRFEDAAYKKHILNFYINSGRIAVHPGYPNGFGVVLLGNVKWKINVEDILKLIRE